MLIAPLIQLFYQPLRLSSQRETIRGLGYRSLFRVPSGREEFLNIIHKLLEPWGSARRGRPSTGGASPRCVLLEMVALAL